MKKIIPFVFVFISSAIFAQHPMTHRVMVNPDGSFSPSRVQIRDGDTVEWRFHDRTDAIIPVDSSGQFSSLCSAYKPYDPADPNEFTGPLPRAASGIFTLGPDGPGSTIETAGAPNSTCDYNQAPDKVGRQYLCNTGELYATMDWTWQNPNFTGVFIRLRWDEVNPGPGVYDWTAMDREIEKAVRNGKLYSLSFKAGSKGTPQWIFDPAIAGATAVERLTFRDAGDGEQPGCGTLMDLGSPADPNYRRHYFALWQAAARHIRERNAWYRALAYVKPSGANLFSHENRLPKNCEPNCAICNPQVWAERGHYTPEALYEFYRQQTALLAAEFPDKDMSYALIQAGFPLVNDNGEYKEPLTLPLPRGTEQTEQILAQGRKDHGLRFIVQHNGLGPKPQDSPIPKPPCPNEGVHHRSDPLPGSAPDARTNGCWKRARPGKLPASRRAIRLKSAIPSTWSQPSRVRGITRMPSLSRSTSKNYGRLRRPAPCSTRTPRDEPSVTGRICFISAGGTTGRRSSAIHLR
jgi:hypothetical protein